MALNKQAKILTTKQQELTLGYLERTRYPLRNKIIFMLSYKAGLRSKEIANLTWLMVCDSEGQLSREINLINKASKGKQSGRTIPMHKDLAVLLAEMLAEQKKNEHFALTNRIITTERDSKTSPQAIVNFFYNLYKDIGFEGWIVSENFYFRPNILSEGYDYISAARKDVETLRAVYGDAV